MNNQKTNPSLNSAIADKNKAPDSKGQANLDYKSAGVDIDAGNLLVEQIKPYSKSTRQPWAAAGLGGFGGVVDLKAVNMQDPLLLLATDGVGTKLKLAIDYNHPQGIGIDLVAMCVNDLVVQGAKPLAFLDYYACGKLDVVQAGKIIRSIAEGCVMAGASLVGGETAEMPGMYRDGDYDLAGFALGAVERDHIINADQVQAGDVLIGLASSGFHSNGYSLVRKVLDRAGVDLTAAPPFKVNYDKTDPDTPRLIDVVMAPTRIYVKPILALLDQARSAVHGICHITGGGFYENLPRILNDQVAAVINKQDWPHQPLYDWLAEMGNITPFELHRSFNCGIGMVLVVAESDQDRVMSLLQAQGESPLLIGEIVPRIADHPQITIQGIKEK